MALRKKLRLVEGLHWKIRGHREGVTEVKGSPVGWPMSSIATDEDIVDRWIEIDDSISVPEQTVDEILADKILDIDEEILSGLDDEESLFTSPRQSSPISSVSSYTLDSPLHITELEIITNHLNTHSGINFGGYAKAIAVSGTNIAVGTSRGSVLIFESENQRLLHSIAADGCPVSCLDFNRTGTLLAVGHGSGLIRIFNVATGRMIDDISDVVQLGQGVLQILFYASGRKLVCLDSGGSVYDLMLSTAVRSRKTRCVFSGCHGEVVYLEVLENDHILALLSLKKLLLVSLKKMCLVYAFAFSGPANRPPLIDWQTINIKGTLQSKTTAFCVGRGSRIEFYYLSHAFSSLRIIRYRVVCLDFGIINLKWIEPFYFLVVDASEKIHMVDTVQGDIAVEDIHNVQLVYATADFKGLSTGGNVSAALNYLADNICYQSVCRFENVIFLLGQSSMYMVSVSDQVAQLESLIDRGQVVPAILFALDIIMGRVINKTKVVNLRHLVSSRIPNLIQALLTLTISGLTNGKVTQLVDHYKKHIQLLIRACITTNQFDLLYNTVYSCLEKDILSKAIFFELIDEVVLDGRLKDPPPALIRFLLFLRCFHLRYSLKGNLSQFEAAVVRIPVEKQDIHFVMTTCRKNRLYDGVIYIYNKAMSDYIGPLEEIFDNVAELVDCEVLSDCEIAQGNKLLLYIQCCLSGRAYPFGTLSEEVATMLPLQVYRCLISYKGKNGTSDSVVYPYLQLLIKFDAIQFFNVIYTCSDSDIFNSKDGRLQKVMEVLYQIISSMDQNAVLFINYFTLVAYLLQKKAIMPSLSTVNELIETVLSFGESIERVADAERCIVEVMRIVSGLDEVKILRQAKKLPHLQVCSHIYINRREFISLVNCYLSNPANARFAKVDYSQTAEIILDHFMEWLSKETLENSEIFLLYYYCFLARRDRGYRTLTDLAERDEELLVLAVQGVVMHNLFEDLDTKLSEFLRCWIEIASRTDRCLNYTVKHKLVLSSVLLLEARKLLEGAFELLDCELEKTWMRDIKLSSKYIYETIRLASIYHEEARQGNWLFKILDRILSLPESELQEESGMMVILNTLIATIMETGSSDAERLVDALFTHPAFRYATYAKFRSLITFMFASCRYEDVLLNETVRCIEEETTQMLNDLVKLSTRRTTGLVTSNMCINCGTSAGKSSYLYSCGHMVHLECDAEKGGHYCLCQTSAFNYHNFKDNLNCKSSQMIRKRMRVDIFSEESLGLLLGPSRRE
uniref:Vacuolar protein sorting-associated protein 8 central domain-containing protein n=1 Tax=Setaria digitata TaxID=48799 RepID=A0A915PZI9_9BILA